MYQPISDYAIIGDTQTVALISSEGSIDWACLPHFDSPALFLRILDDKKGGYCRVTPRRLIAAARRYLPDTNILETTYQTATGVLILIDLMPVCSEVRYGSDVNQSSHRIIRLLRCTSGEIECEIAVKPTFAFATRQATIKSTEEVTVFQSSQDALHIQCSQLSIDETMQATRRVCLQEGEHLPLVLTYTKPDAVVAHLHETEIQQALVETENYWVEWASKCSYAGEHREIIVRSALTLKLLTFAPTGAIVAAPTTSLPEEIGGVRNWDYRFTWLRDATFTLAALMNLGYFGEARDFLNFMKRVARCPIDEFHVMYTIRGERIEHEETLAHLDGYCSSQPVRVGNAAAGQRQLDIYGELLECLYLYASLGGFERHTESLQTDFWEMIERTADYVVRSWRKTDSGIWEVRSVEQHFTHSKAMCWVALDRAIKLAELAGIDKDVSVWIREREAVYATLMNEGYNPKVRAFTQAYGSTALDASILRLPMLGVIDAHDERMRSTLEAIERRLTHNGLIYRYLDSDDGLAGGEATFAICTFWLVHNYALAGKIEEAEHLFRHMLTFANDVGLYAEEIDPVTGAQLGNFPQAFTHIALINSALQLAAARGEIALHVDTLLEATNTVTTD